MSLEDSFINQASSSEMDEEVLDQIQFAQMGESHRIPHIYVRFGIDSLGFDI